MTIEDRVTDQMVSDAYRDWLNQDTPWGQAMSKMLAVKRCKHLRLAATDSLICPDCGLDVRDYHAAREPGAHLPTEEAVLNQVFKSEWASAAKLRRDQAI